MRYTSSTFYILIVILLFSGAIFGLIASCDEHEVEPPVVGSSAGRGPVGGGETQQLSLQANPSETVRVPQGSQGKVNITARVENNIGQMMPDGTKVQWSATLGTLDKSTDSTSGGFSTVTLTFPTDYTGCSTVSARSGDVSAQIQVCVKKVEPTATPVVTATPQPTATAQPTATPSKTFIVTATPQTVSLAGGPCPGNPPTITINALAQTNGNPDNGLQVNFIVSGGGNFNANADVTGPPSNPAGTAQVVFTSDCTTTGTFTVSAQAVDGRSGSIEITVNP